MEVKGVFHHVGTMTSLEPQMVMALALTEISERYILATTVQTYRHADHGDFQRFTEVWKGLLCSSIASCCHVPPSLELSSMK